MTEGARVFGATAALAAPGARSASLRLETVVSTSDGLAYAVDIVAAGVKGPAQLAWAPDGRLFVAEADGRVRVIRPGERDPDVMDWARDRGDGAETRATWRSMREHCWTRRQSGRWASPSTRTSRRITSSMCRFSRRTRASATALRVIRLRDVGGTLGEAATLFEAPLAVDAANGGWARSRRPAPRLRA